MDLVERFNTAIQLWIELTATDKNAKSISLDGWELRRINEKLQESMRLDDTLVTTFFLLTHFSEVYFKQRVVSVVDMSEDPDGVMAYVAKMRDFNVLIKDQEITDIGDRFEAAMHKASAHYGIDPEKVEKVLSNRAGIAFMRYDAFKSMAGLRVNQFLTGEQEPLDARPSYNQNLYQYFDTNGLVAHSCTMPSGVSMFLIRDPDELHSFFGFVLRNGGNLIVLSDVPKHAHPLARSMMRRPDRAMLARADQNWFPYDRLAIKHIYDDEGDYLGTVHDKYREAVNSDVISFHESFVRYCKLSDLSAEQVIWTTMMFDLIVERYWRRPIEPLALSYTAAMMKLTDNNPLEIAAARSQLPTTGYVPLNLKALTLDEVKTDAMSETIVGRSTARERGEGLNQWMEDRYAHLVPHQVLNLTALPDGNIRFLTTKPIKPDTFGNGKSLVVQDEVIHNLPEKELDSYNFFKRHGDGSKTYPLTPLDPTFFGTREEIDNDRKYLARYNYVKALQREADKEFDARKEEIIKWFRKRVVANIDNLLAYGREDKVFASVEGGRYRFGQNYRAQIAAVRLINGGDKHGFGWGTFADAVLSGIDPYKHPRVALTCWFYDVKPTYSLEIAPHTLDELLEMTGCTLDELPDVLRNWNPQKDHLGNQNLDRIDPLDWAAHNPWNNIDFHIRIYLSKRGLKQIRKC